MAKQPDDGHFSLLDDYGTALQVTRSFAELSEILCRLLGEHVKAWIDVNLGDGWQCGTDLDADSEIWIARRSWDPTAPSVEGENNDHLAWFWFGTDEEEDEDENWATHILGFAKEPFKASFVFHGLASKLTKEVAIVRTEKLAARLKDRYSRRAKKKHELEYVTPVRLDAAELSKGLADGDLSRAFAPVTAVLEEFRSYIEDIDAIVSSTP